MTQTSYVSFCFALGLVESQTGFSGVESELMDLTSADVLAELITICNFLVIASENGPENHNSLP